MNVSPISTTYSNDPFSDIISNLKSIAPQLTQLSSPLTSLAGSIDSVDTIITSVNNLFTGLNDACSAINDVQELAEALSAIPVVDAIAGPVADLLSDVATVASDLNSSLSSFQPDVQQVKNLLDDARNGIDKLQNAVNTVSTALPNYINTISIIDCLMEIATPLANVMSTLEVSTKLDTLVNTYNDIKTDVSTALDPLIKLINDILDLLNNIVSLFNQVVNTLGGSIESVVNSIGKITDILDPIKDAFDKVEDAIAPVKWALDAVSCVFNTVFKPVINEVLDATGLSNLVDDLENKLEGYLDIGNLKTDLTNLVGMDMINNLNFLSLNSPSNYFNQITSQWSQVDIALGKYSPSKNANSKAAVVDLLNSISNGSIDPAKPSPIPNWPNAPNFNNTSLSSYSLLTKVNLPSGNVVASRRLTSVQNTGVSNVNVKTYANAVVQQLSDATQPVIVKMQSILPAVNNLLSLVAVFQKSLILPARFTNEVSIYTTYITVTQDFLNFLIQFPQVADILKPLINIADDQAKECLQLPTAITNLQSALTNLEYSVTSIDSSIPTTDLINAAISKMQSWPDNAQTLIQTINTTTIQPTTVQSAQLQLYVGKVETGCTQLQGLLATLSTTADSILTCITSISNEVNSYLKSIQTISTDGNIIPVGGIDKAAKLATVLNQISSILDPLSQLLELEGCKVEATTPLKSGASGAVNTIVKAGTDFISSNNLGTQVSSLLNELANTILPSGKLYTELMNTTDDIHQNQNIISTNVKDLATNLKSFNDSLSDAKSYNITNNGKQAVVSSQFINQDTATQLLNLSGQIAHT